MPNNTKLQAIIDKVLERWAKQNIHTVQDMPGAVISDRPVSVDDGGGYGDPMEDDRPEFVKRDEIGWIKLWPR